MQTKKTSTLKQLLKIIGPGQLFASAAIGTSHLVLSTRAGAHYGMVFFRIIIVTLILKYPFFEFCVRYTNATGRSLMDGFEEQGGWAVIMFMSVISINMFAAVGAIGTVAAGLLSTIFGMRALPIVINLPN